MFVRQAPEVILPDIQGAEEIHRPLRAGIGGRQAANVLLPRPVHARMRPHFQRSELIEADYRLAARFRLAVIPGDPSFF
jgi:hypothetical protein